MKSHMPCKKKRETKITHVGGPQKVEPTETFLFRPWPYNYVECMDPSVAPLDILVANKNQLTRTRKGLVLDVPLATVSAKKLVHSRNVSKKWCAERGLSERFLVSYSPEEFVGLHVDTIESKLRDSGVQNELRRIGNELGVYDFYIVRTVMYGHITSDDKNAPSGPSKVIACTLVRVHVMALSVDISHAPDDNGWCSHMGIRENPIPIKLT